MQLVTILCEPVYNTLILGPPVLQRAVSISVKENNSIIVNLCPSGHQVAFPQPHSVSLQKLDNSLPINDGIVISDCDVKFFEVKRRHSGKYLLQVVNRFESQVGKAEGYFTLDVECKYCLSFCR